MPLNMQDIWRVPQSVAATERARESSQRAEATMQQNMANQKQNLSMAESKSEIETQQKKAEVAYGKLNFANRLLSTVKDDETLKRVREQYLTIYPEDRENVDRIMPGKYSKNFVDMAKTEIRAMADTLKPLTISEGQKVIDPVTMEELASGGAKAKDEFGEPYIDKATGALMQKNIGTGKINKIAAPPKGMVIESDGAGGFTMRTGVSTGAKMTMKTKGTIESKLLGGKEQLKRMEMIQSAFKPEYQELGTRFAREWTGLKAWAGMDVSKEEKGKLTEFKGFQRKAIENINLYIKEITGAQMSEKEATRLRLSQPDPGEQWYQGDDPITFKAKMDDVIKFAGASVARYDKYRSEGLSDTDIKQLAKDDMLEPLENFMQPQESEAEIPSPNTADEYNALPSGTIYIDPDDGKKYRKP